MSDLFDIAGKTALVTGGSRGIGLMIASGFIEAGAKVAISSRKADVCDAVAAELGPNCVSFPADLSTEAECLRLARAVGEWCDGSLNILVNNAGATWGAPFDDFDDAAWDKVLDINVKGVFQLTRFLHAELIAGASAPDPAASSISVLSMAFTCQHSRPTRTPLLRRLCINSHEFSPSVSPANTSL